MLLFPAPEKFNTFNTFNTFDLTASCHSAHHSASGMTARRREESEVDLNDNSQSLIAKG
jgi:hypothetical protein